MFHICIKKLSTILNKELLYGTRKRDKGKSKRVKGGITRKEKGKSMKLVINLSSIKIKELRFY